jgi:dihydrofolate reductase
MRSQVRILQGASQVVALSERRAVEGPRETSTKRDRPPMSIAGGAGSYITGERVAERTVVRKLIYSMSVSLDGFIAGPDGEIDWSAPDEELHRFHNERTRELGAHFCGRRLYETMLYWETADESSSAPAHELEFARIWKDLPKIVFSKTLESVEGKARLARDSMADEVARLKAAPGKDMAVGGAGLASGFSRLGLIDEYRLFVSPVVLGGGTPYFPALDDRIDLELVETQTFGSRVVYLRYRRV